MAVGAAVDAVVHKLLVAADKEHTLKSVRDYCRVILHVRFLHITDVAELISTDATDAGLFGMILTMQTCAPWVAFVDQVTASQCTAVQIKHLADQIVSGVLVTRVLTALVIQNMLHQQMFLRVKVIIFTEARRFILYTLEVVRTT